MKSNWNLNFVKIPLLFIVLKKKDNYGSSLQFPNGMHSIFHHPFKGEKMACPFQSYLPRSLRPDA